MWCVTPIFHSLLSYSLQKLQIWCWLPEGKWECGKILSASANDADVLISSGKVSRLDNAMYATDIQ